MRHGQPSRAGAAAITLLAALLACNAPGLSGGGAGDMPLAPTDPPLPTTTAPLPVDEGPQPAETPDTGWLALEPGLDLRQSRIPLGSNSVPVTLVRIDTAHYTFRVHYEPHNPVPVSGWQARTGAPLVINGGFFMADNTTLGLVVVDGQAHGTSFDRHGGMLSISEGAVHLRSLAQEPYQPGEALEQAVQGRPMLLYPGRFPTEFDLSPEASRRTAVATDPLGRLIFVVVDYGALTLYDLRDWLAATPDLDLFAALNLDGGGSTGMALAAGGQSLLIDSWSEIPGVIAFYPQP